MSTSILINARELYQSREYNKTIDLLKKFLQSDSKNVDDNISACYYISLCYNNLNDDENRINYLLKSFQYDKPRAEICCALGYYFGDKKDYQTAIF